MNFYEGIFVLQFCIYLGITLAKIYNVMSLAKWYDVKISWILFISTLITTLISFLTIMVYNDNLLLIQLFRFQFYSLILHIPLLVGEIFFNGQETNIKSRERYNPQRSEA